MFRNCAAETIFRVIGDHAFYHQSIGGFMLIGIVSDTHRNRELHTRAVDFFSEEGVEKVYHLGDDYVDSELEVEYGLDVIRIPGLYCPEYKGRDVENIGYDTVQGIRIVMAHDLKDIPSGDLRCHDIIIHGHTHKMEIRVENGRIYVNPGHLKSDSDKGRPPSFATIEIDMGIISIKIHGIDAKVLSEMRFRQEEAGLYRI